MSFNWCPDENAPQGPQWLQSWSVIQGHTTASQAGAKLRLCGADYAAAMRSLYQRQLVCRTNKNRWMHQHNNQRQSTLAFQPPRAGRRTFSLAHRRRGRPCAREIVRYMSSGGSLAQVGRSCLPPWCRHWYFSGAGEVPVVEVSTRARCKLRHGGDTLLVGRHQVVGLGALRKRWRGREAAVSESDRERRAHG